MLIGQCIHDITVSYGLVLSLFLAGLVGGVTHCAGMCAPFVLAQTGAGAEVRRLRSSLLLPYHLGRMTTYVTLAVLVNTAFNLAFVFSDLKLLVSAPLLVLAGVIFLVTAFPAMAAVFPWAAALQIAAPYKFVSRFSAGLMNNPGVLQRYGLGVLLGFMPCGLVVAALMAAATATGPLQAAGAMAAFTLGTVPALVLVALGGQEIKRRYPQASSRLSQGAMVVSGVWLFALAGMMIF